MARRPIWLWPNLLSLDAPLVAVAWFWVFKQVWAVEYVGSTSALPWFLALAVWCIYTSDRLLDARMAQMGTRRAAPRHEFHRRWRHVLTVVLLLGVVGAVFLFYRTQARGLINHGVFIVGLVVGYFAISFFETGKRVSYVKNVFAGLAFGYGTAVGVHFYDNPDIRALWLSPEVIAFGVLCILNMTAIDHWEESRDSRDPEERAIYELVLNILLIVLAGFALLMALRSERLHLDAQKAFFVAILVAAGGLQILNRMRSRFSLDALRVLADVAMLLPLPVFFGMLRVRGLV